MDQRGPKRDTLALCCVVLCDTIGEIAKPNINEDQIMIDEIMLAGLFTDRRPQSIVQLVFIWKSCANTQMHAQQTN